MKRVVPHWKHVYATATIAGMLVFAAGCSKAPEPEKKEAEVKPAPPPPSVPDVKESAAVKAKAEKPKPGAKATKQKVADTFGKGKASVTVKGHPGGVQHSFWQEELDVDGSGNPVMVDEAWDNHHKVLYVSSDRKFGCRNGQTADGSTLMTVYGKGNTLHKPAGSGWWVSELDAGECGVQEAGIYGCRFDADGNNTDCGTATVQSEADDVVIVPLPQGGGAGGAAPAAPANPPAAPSGDGKQ